ncbi:hypothetical protein FXV77_14910 [Sphingobacterium phlebotomi]|uniref:Uncharacterized protein n=1 Tax=Sphingobacterium phlebotomi TaxID=2605433 RepID=A0A5D4H2A6_9SPHI|nr:hypothetical protein [Sphingobacterium phlebotomi]TYR34758.1 hypothetical protein FXV77_14910 [Sphingobacterium phlebotomi]
MLDLIRKCTIRHWLIIATVNLLIVAGFGFLMRLKMIFPLTWANQKYIMHAHSHFAFAGWVSHALMVFMLMAIFRLRSNNRLPTRYQYIITANLLASYGMLICFTVQGYGLFAIIFSTLTLLISFIFAGFTWREIGRSDSPLVVKYWFKASLFFSVLSSLGTFSLVRLMATQQLDPLKQLASVYFYLHFQYNGWFLFACIGLFLYWLWDSNGIVACSKRLFWLFFSCVIPAYFLSVLWWKAFPDWLYAVVVATVVLQLGIWGWFIRYIFLSLRKGDSMQIINPTTKIIWTGVAVAVFLKIALQAASVIPSLSQLVYGYRPIVIAYLHLVLLVIVSLFILGFAFQMQTLRLSKMAHRWMMGFAVGVVLNEFMLMIQGIGGFVRTYIPLTNHFLILAAGIMVISVCGILWKQRE